MKAFIEKIAYYLPERVEENPLGRLTDKTGILRRHIAAERETSSDLAVKAFENLDLTLGERREIDFLLLCTESPDYVLPPSSCLLQDKLGLRKSVGAFDFNLGCSGYIYGLSMAKGLVESGQARKILLITAETYSKFIHPDDGATMPLFGDAATATVVVAVDGRQEGLAGFAFGTDGSGYKNLWIPAGGARCRFGGEHLFTQDGDKNVQSRDFYIRMNGSAISNFALTAVPEMLEGILSRTDKKREEIDYFVFHQANKFMLDFLRKRCKLSDQPFWSDVTDYGNSVSNSIPIAIRDMRISCPDAKNIISIGFGVGLSWAGCLINLGKLK